MQVEVCGGLRAASCDAGVSVSSSLFHMFDYFCMLTCIRATRHARYTNAAVALLQCRTWRPAVDAARLALLWGGWEFSKDAARLESAGLDMPAIIKHLSIAVTHSRTVAPDGRRLLKQDGERNQRVATLPCAVWHVSALTWCARYTSTTPASCSRHTLRLQRNADEASGAVDF